MQKIENIYDAPAITVVEVKACGRICSASSNSLVIMLGNETGTNPLTDYGVQSYDAGDALGW